MKKVCFVSFACLLGMTSMNAYAVKASDSDTNKQSVAADNTWYSQPKAVLRVLNKLESSVNMFTIPVGETAQYKTLTISVQKCLTRPASASPDSTAFVTITDSKLSTDPFAAWIFVAEPGASVFEHPLYNVSLVGCKGEVSEKPVELKSTVPNQQPTGQNNPNDLEQSLERSIQSQH